MSQGLHHDTIVFEKRDPLHSLLVLSTDLCMNNKIHEKHSQTVFCIQDSHMEYLMKCLSSPPLNPKLNHCVSVHGQLGASHALHTNNSSLAWFHADVCVNAPLTLVLETGDGRLMLWFSKPLLLDEQRVLRCIKFTEMFSYKQRRMHSTNNRTVIHRTVQIFISHQTM
jgi:hypothetical protein